MTKGVTVCLSFKLCLHSLQYAQLRTPGLLLLSLLLLYLVDAVFENYYFCMVV